MHRYLKKAVCYLAILIFVPYFVTAFLNGSGRGGSVEVDETYVRVESSESGDGSGNGADIADGKREMAVARKIEMVREVEMWMTIV